MMKPTRKLLILAAVLLGLGLFAAPQAQAGWGHGHRYGYGYGYGHSYGYYGYGYGYGHSYGYYGSGYSSFYRPRWAPVCAPRCTPVCSVSICDPCDGWYVGVRPGPVRRALFGPYRWYGSHGCCSVCYADPCCCYGGSVVSVDSDPDVQSTQKPTLAPPVDVPADTPAAGTPNQPTLAPAPAPAPAPTTFAPVPELPAPVDPGPVPLGPMPDPVSPSNDLQLPDPTVPSSALDPLAPQGAAMPSGEGVISILVPENAQVTINGYVTKSNGRVRRYVSQNLKPGLVYPFNIQVNVVRDGRTLTDSRQVKLTGGAIEAVVFNFDKAAVERIAQAW